MSQEGGFERVWLAKLSDRLDEIAGEEIRKEVLKGSEELSSKVSREEVIEWTRGAMERLDSLLDKQKRKDVMTACACQYPKSDLQEARKRYEETGDIDSAHAVLQGQFESLLRDTLGLGEELVAKIVDRGWGSAGVKKGNTIIATKIPKSDYLIEYMRETDPEKKRPLYCHCPRVRDALRTAQAVSPTYCYCGAGFYRGIWEEILQKPVEVEVLETVLQGDEVCKIAIRLP